MKTILFCMFLAFCALLPSVSRAQDKTNDFHAIFDSYKKSCGGDIYTNCDAADKNQETLFHEAVRVAQSTNKNILVVVGADWCPACRAFSKSLSPGLKDPKNAWVEQKFVIAEFNNDMKSTQLVLTALGLNVPGIPVGAIYDPIHKNVLQRFYPSSYAKIEDFFGFLRDQKAAAEPEKNKDYIGWAIRRSLLEEPVAMAVGWGTTDYIPSTQLQGAQRAELIRDARSGMLYLHGFMWINAVRAFNMALRLEPNNATLIALKARALVQIDQDGDSTEFLEMVNSALAIKSFKMDDDDALFVAYTRAQICKSRLDACNDKRIAVLRPEDIGNRVLARGLHKADYIALVGYDAANIDALNKILQEDPQNPSAHHYLTHIYESMGEIEKAAIDAEFYAQAAPKSPHGQHMWGHILPQQGRWQQALAQFMKADRLHLEEFKTDDIKPGEDWHYSHNIDLLSATMMYLNLTSDLEKLMQVACDKNGVGCSNRVALDFMTDNFGRIEQDLKNEFGALLNDARESSLVAPVQILEAFGLRDYASAKKLYAKFVAPEPLVSSNPNETDLSIYPRLAYAVIVQQQNSAQVAGLLKILNAQLTETGFEAWSDGVVYSRMLEHVLTQNGEIEMATEIKKMVAAAHPVSTGTGCPACDGLARRAAVTGKTSLPQTVKN